MWLIWAKAGEVLIGGYLMPGNGSSMPGIGRQRLSQNLIHVTLASCACVNIVCVNVPHGVLREWNTPIAAEYVFNHYLLCYIPKKSTPRAAENRVLHKNFLEQQFHVDGTVHIWLYNHFPVCIFQMPKTSRNEAIQTSDSDFDSPYKRPKVIIDVRTFALCCYVTLAAAVTLWYYSNHYQSACTVKYIPYSTHVIFFCMYSWAVTPILNLPESPPLARIS